MSCKIEKAKNGKINKVLDAVGNPSQLFKQLLNIPVLGVEEALDIYKNIYSKELRDIVKEVPSETNDIRFSKAEIQSSYFSNALSAIGNLKDKNVKNVQGWMKALTDVQKNGGIKNVNQELEWIGLEDYLNRYVKENNPKAGNISFDAVNNYIQSNQIEIVEVSKGYAPINNEGRPLVIPKVVEENVPAKDYIYFKRRNVEGGTIIDVVDNLKNREVFGYTIAIEPTGEISAFIKGKLVNFNSEQDAIDSILSEIPSVKRYFIYNEFGEKLEGSYDAEWVAMETYYYNDAAQNYANDGVREYDTKYSGYQLKGGENYREVLLTMPPRKPKINKYSAKVKGENIEIKKEKYYNKDIYNLYDNGEIVSSFDEVFAKELEVEFNEENALKTLKPEYIESLKTAKELYGNVNIYYIYNNEGVLVEEMPGSTEKEALDAMANKDLLYKLDSGEESYAYSSSHWDEKNILAHVRLNEKTLPDGRRVLVLNEVQSDWAQDGRKQGWEGNEKQVEREQLRLKVQEQKDKIRDIELRLSKLQPLTKEEKAELKKQKFKLEDARSNARNNRDWDALGGEISKIEEQLNNYEDTKDRLKSDIYSLKYEGNNSLSILEDNLYNFDRVNGDVSGGLLNMPYKNTDQWTSLVTRRVLQMAAQEGYDGVAFATGQQSADMYSLSQQVNSIDIRPQGEIKAVYVSMKNNTDDTVFVNKEGVITESASGAYNGKKAEEVLGKDLTRKILETEKETTLEGEGLEFGGEGMKTFYDKIVTKVAQKEAQRFDKNAKLEEVDFDNTSEVPLIKNVTNVILEGRNYQRYLRNYESNEVLSITELQMAIVDDMTDLLTRNNFDSIEDARIAKEKNDEDGIAVVKIYEQALEDHDNLEGKTLDDLEIVIRPNTKAVTDKLALAKQPFIAITDKMRSELSKGVPLFKKGGNKGQLAEKEVIDRLKENGLSNNVFEMTTQEINDKLEELGVDAETRKQVIAYHGSPYSFDRFTTNAMGTGEGAQAFGWGLYFTDLESIARNYAKVLSSNNSENTAKKLLGKNKIDLTSDFATDFINNLRDNVLISNSKEELISTFKNYVSYNEKLIEEIADDMENYPLDRDPLLIELEKLKNSLLDNNKAVELVNQITDSEFSVAKNGKGSKNLYKVSLHKGKTPDQYTWLEWDKAIPQNISETINKAINNSTEFTSEEKENLTPISTFDSASGLYNRIKDLLGHKEASLFLLENGIDGIKYPAESISRGATSDTARGFNYVVFDENAITIEEQIQFQKTLNSLGINLTVNGFVYKNEVYLNKEVATNETALHEFSHLFNSWLKENKSELYNKGIELVKVELAKESSDIKDIIDYVKSTQPNLKGEALLEEILTELTGRKGTELLETKKGGIVDWLKEVWSEIAKMLGLTQMSPEQVANLTLGQYAEAVGVDLLKGENFGKVSEQNGVRYQVIGEKGASKVEEYKKLLDQAKELEKQNKDYSQTGWFKTENNEWKYFSNEYVSQFKFKEGVKINTPQKFSDVIEDNIIFQLYPQSKNLKIVLYDDTYKNTNLGRDAREINGAYSKHNGTIFVNIRNRDGKSAEHIIGHELNHFVQGIEQFSTGGNEISILTYAINLANVTRNPNQTVLEQLESFDTTQLSENDKKIVETAKDVYKAFDKKDREKLIEYYQRIEGEVDSRAVEMAISLKNSGESFDYKSLRSSVLKKDGIDPNQVVSLYYKDFEYSIPQEVTDEEINALISQGVITYTDENKLSCGI